jgi:ubiquinone/menaquinone biosynthesis C-methylase UbiE
VADTSSSFAGSIPELYDRYLGPVLFQPYAEDLARRVAERTTGAVLETACGTGRLTRQLRAHLPPAIRLVATDLSQPMLDYAQEALGSPERIEWQQADCTALPFPAGSFGALACQFGLMFPPDKPAALREARRVLADGGWLLFNVWGSLSENPYAQVMQETIAGAFPEDPPTFLNVPFGFHNADVWHALLQESGFADHQHEVVTLEARSPTAEDVAYGQIQGSPLRHEIEARGGDFDRIVAAVTVALVRLGGEAPFRSSVQAIVFTARAG